jgi:ribosomal RNA-processing protein 17
MPPPSKRRRVEKNASAVEEVMFDPSARQEYLTGFHKRKVQRAKHAQEIAEKRARAEKIEHRRKIREDRRQEIEAHVQAVNATLRNMMESSDEEDDGGERGGAEWDGIDDEETMVVEEIDHEAEYIDEEKYTTVTVEAMDVSKEGSFKTAEGTDERDDEDGAEKKTVTLAVEAPVKQQRKWTKDKPARDPGKKRLKKKRNFKYENKAERKDARSKQKARNSKQARERRDRG